MHSKPRRHGASTVGRWLLSDPISGSAAAPAEALAGSPASAWPHHIVFQASTAAYEQQTSATSGARHHDTYRSIHSFNPKQMQPWHWPAAPASARLVYSHHSHRKGSVYAASHCYNAWETRHHPLKAPFIESIAAATPARIPWWHLDHNSQPSSSLSAA